MRRCSLDEKEEWREKERERGRGRERDLFHGPEQLHMVTTYTQVHIMLCACFKYYFTFFIKRILSFLIWLLWSDLEHKIRSSKKFEEITWLQMSSSKNLKENVRLTIVGERWLKMKDRRSNRQIQRLWQKRFTYKRTQRKLLLLLLPLKDELEKDRRRGNRRMEVKEDLKSEQIFVVWLRHSDTEDTMDWWTTILRDWKTKTIF